MHAGMPHDRAFRPGCSAIRLALALGLTLMGPIAPARSQTAPPVAAPAQPAPAAPGGDWGGTTRVDRAAPPAAPTVPLRPTLPAPGNPANTTVVPRSAPEPRAAPPGIQAGEVRLEAFLTDDGQRIEQGLVWHAFEDLPATSAAAGPAPTTGPGAEQRPKPRHVGSWKEASPTVRLAPGSYQITATFGRAHMMRKISVRLGPAAAPERFVLNAGGLRITAQLTNGEPIPEIAFGYDILAGEFDQSGLRAKVLSGVKPGLIIRLNAGIYQIVSTYGDANSIVRADVTVEAGKLTEATVTHQAAKVTFKLVTRPGGDALADTQWTILSAAGERIRESNGALPSHILAAGAYEVHARQADRIYKRSFILSAGDPQQIEVLIPPGGR
ncbi:MAG: hypothetical protein ACKVP7_23315 [Hyphomicrobiaceae bacterium]